jgi:hypothetical protein
MTTEVDRVFHEWDDALGRKNADEALALYAPDATLESPLVRRLLNTESGIVNGRQDLREFIERVFATQPAERRRSRSGYCFDGTRLMWEYPRLTPDGDQMDFVEVMQLRGGLIQQHRVYWGWFGLKLLADGGPH